MKNYDVAIIGGGTAGCAAAYISGKLGLKTLLIEKGIHMGGTITSGLVVPVMNSGENQINTEFYETLISELAKIGGQTTYMGNPGWFNPELCKIVLDEMLNSVNVEIKFMSEVLEAQINEKLITSLTIRTNTLSTYTRAIYTNNKQCKPAEILSTYNDEVHTNNADVDNFELLSEHIGARYVIDATGNCEFAKLINCEFLKDSENIFQPMSLRFIMSGIDAKTFTNWLLEVDSDRNVTTVRNTDNEYHFSTAYTRDADKQWALAPYFEDAIDKNVLTARDCNYFQLFSIAGMPGAVAFNCPRIPENLNPNSVSDCSKALIEARQSIYRICEFCKKYFPGFKHAYISNIADMLGVRVSNRIRGKYVYTEQDLRSGKKFANPALISNYPIDVHGADKNSSKLEHCGEYQLPTESLISADYDNLLVAGRGISAEYNAQGALRVQAGCFSMGEAAARYIYDQIRSDN